MDLLRFPNSGSSCRGSSRPRAQSTAARPQGVVARGAPARGGRPWRACKGLLPEARSHGAATSGAPARGRPPAARPLFTPLTASG
ncbi:hypothetical protein BHE74_00036716 [Ensete ventricosum]|nr:hypothetical protein GW17_00046428 [Ensete ventricosum]RWW56553.1 hypothetical protein BHE74_00036716 [Ensete ventricosum]RZS00075.1 hypothetical protein BHM03_00029714 [Ensete ventricosum]